MLKEYKRRRALGERAASALRSSRIVTEFRELEGECARLDVEWDECVELEDVACDRSCFDSDAQYQRHVSEIVERCNSEGVFGLVARVRMLEGDWETVDSVYGFIGEDWKDSGYDVDMMAAALDVHRNALAEFHGMEELSTGGIVADSGF